MANLKAVKADDPKVTDAHGRPLYELAPNLQPRLDEKREALEARIKLMDEQEAAALAAFPPAPGVSRQ